MRLTRFPEGTKYDDTAAVLDHYALAWTDVAAFPEDGVYTTTSALGFAKRKAADVLYYDDKMRNALDLSLPESRRQNLTDEILKRVLEYIQENDFIARNRKEKRRIRNLISNYLVGVNEDDVEVLSPNGSSLLEQRVREAMGELTQFTPYLPLLFVGSLGKGFDGTPREAMNAYEKILGETEYAEKLGFEGRNSLKREVHRIVRNSTWKHVDLKRVQGIVATACVVPTRKSRVYTGEPTVRHLTTIARKCLEPEPGMRIFVKPPTDQ